MKHKEQLIAEAKIWITDALDQIQKFQDKPFEYGNSALTRAQEASEQAAKRLLSAQVVRF